LIRRKQILSLLTGLLLATFSKAAVPPGFKVNPGPITDTTIKNDTLAQTANDTKQGFKDLFVSSAFGNSINTKQLNAEAIGFVQDYIDKYGKTMEAMKSWGKPYFDLMDGILTQHGLPKELKYLAVIESYLQSNVRSWAGAVGPWQLMPATARNFGLRVSQYYDERTDYFKSTHAACRYLTDLFSIYGDWLLVIAAYNGGPGNVNNAIKKSGSRDFWALQNFLPVESKNHVKKFIATHYIMEGAGGVTTATKEEAKDQLVIIDSKEELIESKMQVINGRYNSFIIAKNIAMDITAFNKLNPYFDKLIADNDGRYELRLPEDKMDIFLAKKYDILYESMQLLLNQANGSNR
jgi:membrane-bound lytic murein transglycosylase D